MLSPDFPVSDTANTGTSDAQLTMELLELELVLESIDMEQPDFTTRVRKAATAMGGVFLFDLPASGLMENCSRIAVLRIPQDGTSLMATVFVCLEADGASFRIELPDEQTADLRNFAEAFVEVLGQIR